MAFSFTELNYNYIETQPNDKARAPFTVNSSTHKHSSTHQLITLITLITLNITAACLH